MTDPNDPTSIPMLTDVIVPGRPPIGRPASASASQEASSAREATFDARDVEFIAERLRGRFSSYLREDARRVIDARCRDAIEEHTNWLVRQVTREVVSALEAEVAGWVSDAVREELARHTSRR